MKFQCCACLESKPARDFSKSQLRVKNAPRCRECVEQCRATVIPKPRTGSRLCKRCSKPVEGTVDTVRMCQKCADKTMQERLEHGKHSARSSSATRSGACRVRDVQQRYGHLCEIPIQAYQEAEVAHGWDDYVTAEDVQRASDAWDARSILHDIDTQWGAMPRGGAYSDSNYYYGPGEYDYY